MSKIPSFWGWLLTVAAFCPISAAMPAEELLMPAAVDERVELLSIVFRLAGNPEYNQNQLASYVSAIRDHFDKFKDHPCIQFAKEMADGRGISFDAPMSLALHITPPPDLKPLFPFSDAAPDERWGKDDAEKFLVLLRLFYDDAGCRGFFESQSRLYRSAEDRFKTVQDALDATWYKRFYGTVPSGKLNIILGIGNGACNYGPKVTFPGGKEDAYAVMGAWTIDEDGKPLYASGFYLSILIHEFNHSFINALNEKILGRLEGPGTVLMAPVEELMRSQAYPNVLTMMNEALVRAAVIRYIAEHDPDGARAGRELGSQLSNGFLWIKGLVEALKGYEKNRDRFPTLEGYMPEIVRFYEHAAVNLHDLLAPCGRVISVQPFRNHAEDVSAGLSGMKVVFNTPIFSDDEISASAGPLGEDHFPVVKEGVEFTEDHRALLLKIKLKPRTRYQVALPGLRFRTAEHYPLIDNLIEFKTK